MLYLWLRTSQCWWEFHRRLTSMIPSGSMPSGPLSLWTTETHGYLSFQAALVNDLNELNPLCPRIMRIKRIFCGTKTPPFISLPGSTLYHSSQTWHEKRSLRPLCCDARPCGEAAIFATYNQDGRFSIQGRKRQGRVDASRRKQSHSHVECGQVVDKRRHLRVQSARII